MGNPLRDRRAASEWASAGQVIEFAEEIGSFEALATIVGTDLAALDPTKTPGDWRKRAVQGVLRFGIIDADGQVPSLTGAVSADVDAVCQRCLEPFRLQLRIEPRLLLLEQKKEADGYDEYEVWELEETSLRPHDIVEEMLIMAMPFSAMHDNMADCRVFSTHDEDTDKTVRPFAALRSQMDQDKEDPDS